MGHVWSAFGKNGEAEEERWERRQPTVHRQGREMLLAFRSLALAAPQDRINILWPWQWNTPEHRSVLPVLARATNARAKKLISGWKIFKNDFHCQGEASSLTTGVAWACLSSKGTKGVDVVQQIPLSTAGIRRNFQKSPICVRRLYSSSWHGNWQHEPFGASAMRLLCSSFRAMKGWDCMSRLVYNARDLHGEISFLNLRSERKRRRCASVRKTSPTAKAFHSIGFDIKTEWFSLSPHTDEASFFRLFYGLS